MSEPQRIDWADGPVECLGCGRMLRPPRTPATGVWADTLAVTSWQRCATCYADFLAVGRIEEQLAEVPRQEFLWQWPMTAPYRLPQAQLEIEAMADLMDHLSAVGWLLADRPERVSSGRLEWLVRVVGTSSAVRRRLQLRPPAAVIAGAGSRWVLSRALVQEGVSLVHMEMDLVADAAAVLRERGMVAVGAPERRPVVHGRAPVMRLRVPVRRATVAEAAALGRLHAVAMVAAGSGEGAAA